METLEMLKIATGITSAVYIILIFLEYFAYKKKGIQYSKKEAAASIANGIIHASLNRIFPLGTKIFIWMAAYEIAPYKMENGLLQFVVAFLLCDFMYYFHHYLNHKFDFLWAMHQTHHTSRELNLATGARVSWLTPFVAAFLFAPLALLGIHPFYMLMSLTCVFYGQWWCHTRLIGKLGIFEKFLNTPSLHRVHHSPDPDKMRSNYAGFLCIWDRIFGTYREEKETITEFGTSQGFVGYNPVSINLKEFLLYFINLFRLGFKREQR